MTTRQWTPEQKNVIHAAPQTLLVNAGAGTGKTASLIERLLTLLDREPNSPDPAERPASLQQIVVVTFTNAAAREMKERLAKGLRARVDLLQSENRTTDRLRHLRSELALLPRATISTLHSFCITLLREYGHLIGLAPDLEILNEEEAHLLRTELIEERLEQLAETPEGHSQLKALLSGLSLSAGLKTLIQEVRSTHHFLEALSSPAEFIEKSLGPYLEAADESVPLLETQAVRCMMTELEAALDSYERQLGQIESGLHLAELSNGTANYLPKVVALLEVVAHVRQEISQRGTIPDLRCLKPANKPQARFAKTGSDFTVIERATLLKETYDTLNNITNKQDVSLEAVRRQTASHLAPLQTMLITLGQELSLAFQQSCCNSNRLTFNQLERLTLNLLEGNAEVSTLLRKTYEHVFVDEFQDISGLQGKLLELIAQPSTPHPEEPGNLFAVGDVKQSIYGFRQADPQQFLNRLQSYAPFNPHAPQHPGARLDLLQNFRSTPPLLRTLNGIFERLFSPLIGGIWFDESHAFVPGQQEPKPSELPRLEVLVLSDSAAEDSDSDSEESTPSTEGDAYLDADLDQGAKEARHVVHRIQQLNRPYGEIAILLRAGRGNAPKLISELRRAGIPFQTQEAIGFLAQQEVNDLLCLLHVIDSPYNDVELIGLLRGPMFGWSADELVQLRLVNAKGRLADNLREVGQLNPLEPAASIQPRAAEVLAKLAHWQRCSIQESVSDFINRLYRDGALVDCYSAMSNGEQRVRNLQFFQERAAQYDRFARKGLAGFLEFVESLLEEGKELGKPPVASSDAEAVHLMTMHKSKGLEFPVVICPFLGTKFNLQDLRNRVLLDRNGGVGIRLQPTAEADSLDKSIPLHEPLKQKIKERFLSEELRLLYVALTRAEEQLILTGVKKKWSSSFEDLETFTATSKPERETAVQKAGCFLDWVLLGIGNTPQLHELTESVQQSSTNENGLAVGWRFLDEQLPELEPGSKTEPTPTAENSFAEEFKRLMEWENRPKAPVLRAKISATEAKRERETLHHAYLPPATVRTQNTPLEHTTEKPKPADEQWLPPFYRNQQLKKNTRLSGSEKGKIVHRFLALVDLEALSKGASLEDEWNRLEAANFFQPEEKSALWFPALETMFREMEVGKCMLKYPTFVQRELAFTAAVPARLFAGEAEETGKHDETVLLQGMVDALINVPEGVRGGPILRLIDFKTDYWDGTSSHFDSLKKAYTPQILLYQYGLEKSLGRKMDESCLYFLGAEQPYVVPSPRSEQEWQAFLKQTLIEAVSPTNEW